MKNVFKILYRVLQALPIIAQLLEVFISKSEDPDSSGVRKSDKDIIDNV